MLVPEADDVTQLVDNNAKLVTVFPDRYSLRPIPPLADEGAAATRTFRKNNVIRVFVCSFDELDAGVVFPVSHGLLKQGAVIAAKIALYLVGNDSVVPETFRPGSRCTCRPSALCRS